MALKLNGTNSVAAPAYAGADADTGLQCGTDEVNLVTGGTARLHIDSSGKIGVGTSSPKEVVDARGAAVFSGDHATSQNAYGTAHGIMLSSTSNIASIKAVSNGSNDVGIRFIPLSSGSGSEAMRITGSGNVGIGTTSTDYELDVRSSDTTTVNINAGTSNLSRLFFSDSTDGLTNFARGYLNYDHSGDSLRIGSAGLERLRIDSSGRVLIGTTTEGAADADDLTIARNGDCGITLRTGTTSTGSIYFSDATSGGGEADGYIDYNQSNRYMRFGTAQGERMRIDSSGNVGIGTTSPAGKLTVASRFDLQNSDSTNDRTIFAFGSNNLEIETRTSKGIILKTNQNERMRIDSAGVVSINQSSASNIFRIQSSGSTESNMLFQNSTSGTGAGNGLYAGIDPSANAYLWNYENKPLIFATNNSERMRITNGGDVLINKTSSSQSTVGVQFLQNGPAEITVSNNRGLLINRKDNDGQLVAFDQDGTTEGTVTVSGSTVSFNGGHLSRWSQLAAGAARTEILRGSVLSNLDEMCEWGEEDNEQLNRMKVSDVEGDANVAGVFQDWDDDDDTYTNDFYCAMTGDFIVRIAQGTTVARGDLLMSAGDGTAKPQDDDIVRSKTIAKVTSTTVSTTYSDGSYCVPCVLMAC